MDVDFYTLERPVQDRFADATRAIGVPAPLAAEPPRDRRALFWFAGAAAVFAGLASLLSRGFGNLGHPAALPPVPFAVVYAVLAAGATYCLLRGLSVRGARANLPYEPGLYLFPAGVYDARGAAIRVFRHTDVNKVEASGSTLRVAAAGGQFVFTFPDTDTADKARLALDEASRQYAEALRSENRRDQARFDPLVDNGYASPFSPQLRLAKVEPMWAKLSLLVAVASGAALGPALWKVRNVLSERTIFAEAVRRDTADAYRAYLARGGPRPEVPDIRLPRSELRAAVEAGTVEALEAFAAGHPASKIQVEIDAALQAAVMADLERAKEEKTVTALREFQARRAAYPFAKSHVDAASVALFRGVLRAYAEGKEPRVASFFERLLGYTKVHGPTASVLFIRKIPESVEDADGQVKRSAYFMGKESVPSQYFAGGYAEKREEAAAGRLIEAISKPFPRDMLELRRAPTITDGAEPKITEPTLVVEYFPEMAGGYMSPKPRGVFVGVGMMFKASFQIPGDGQPLEYKYSLWKTPNPQILKAEGATVADVYEKMAGDGIDRFLKGFLAPITGEKSETAKAD